MTLPFKAVAVDMDGTFLDDRKQFNHKEFDQILTDFYKNKNLISYFWLYIREYKQ